MQNLFKIATSTDKTTFNDLPEPIIGSHATITFSDMQMTNDALNQFVTYLQNHNVSELDWINLAYLIRHFLGLTPAIYLLANVYTGSSDYPESLVQIISPDALLDADDREKTPIPSRYKPELLLTDPRKLIMTGLMRELLVDQNGSIPYLIKDIEEKERLLNQVIPLITKAKKAHDQYIVSNEDKKSSLTDEWVNICRCLGIELKNLDIEKLITSATNIKEAKRAIIRAKGIVGETDSIYAKDLTDLLDVLIQLHDRVERNSAFSHLDMIRNRQVVSALNAKQSLFLPMKGDDGVIIGCLVLYAHSADDQPSKQILPEDDEISRNICQLLMSSTRAPFVRIIGNRAKSEQKKILCQLSELAKIRAGTEDEIKDKLRTFVTAIYTSFVGVAPAPNVLEALLRELSTH